MICLPISLLKECTPLIIWAFTHPFHPTLLQVTISATEDSLLISWPHRRLKNHLETDKVFDNVFYQLVGKDISHKLYQIQEKLLSNPDYMEALASRHSSMVNVRNSIVSMSTVNLQKLNCLQGRYEFCGINSFKLATRFFFSKCWPMQIS